jgi:hypothetical protein
MSTDPRAENPAPDQPNPDAVARAWLRDVYQGDTVPQLTVRAVVTGMRARFPKSLSVVSVESVVPFNWLIHFADP